MSDVSPAALAAVAAAVPPVSAARIAFVASETTHAKDAERALTERYGTCPIGEASVIVALGGDGTMLECLHRVLAGLADGAAHAEAAPAVPVYGMNCGSVGFLMNAYSEADLRARLERAQAALLHPLRMHAVRATGSVEEALALNEVALLRQLRQAAKIRITIDGQVRLAELMCDGILVATPAGSTAYNLSAHGPIVPLSANLLPLTPISAFRPRRWRGALLPSTADVLFDVLEPGKRPVAAVADFTEVRDVVSVAVIEDRTLSVTILFDPDLGLPERIIAEQFTA